MFSLRDHQKVSPQNGEKIERRKWDYLMDENAHVHLHMGSSLWVWYFFFFFFN